MVNSSDSLLGIKRKPFLKICFLLLIVGCQMFTE